MGIKGAGASVEMPTYLQFIQSFYSFRFRDEVYFIIEFGPVFENLLMMLCLHHRPSTCRHDGVCNGTSCFGPNVNGDLFLFFKSLVPCCYLGRQLTFVLWPCILQPWYYCTLAFYLPYSGTSYAVVQKIWWQVPLCLVPGVKTQDSVTILMLIESCSHWVHLGHGVGSRCIVLQSEYPIC